MPWGSVHAPIPRTGACTRPPGAACSPRNLLFGPADDDLVLLDRHRHGPVAGPVLRVRGVVGDGRVEPQAVALLAVVEGPLEGLAAPRPARPPAAAGAALGRLLGLGVLLVGLARALGLLGLPARPLGRLELLGDPRVVGGAQVELVVVARGRGVGAALVVEQ